jgi:predicted nucleotidyltransferase
MNETHPRTADNDIEAAMRIAARASDIDIAILPDAPLEPGTLARTRDALEESTLPYEVEVIDLSSVDETFRRKVLSEAIGWNG